MNLDVLSASTCFELPEGVRHMTVVGTSQMRKHGENDYMRQVYTQTDFAFKQHFCWP